MKVKIIVPPNASTPQTFSPIGLYMLPHGPACLVTALKENGHQAVVQDLSFMWREFQEKIFEGFDSENVKRLFRMLHKGFPDKRLEAFTEKMFSYAMEGGPCDLYGFSATSFLAMPSALLLAKKIKEKLGKPVVLGGTCFDTFNVEKFPFLADYIIIGDGAPPLLKLLSYLEGRLKIEEIPNLIHKREGRLIMNQSVFFDINDISMPDYEGLDLESYKVKKRLDTVDYVPQAMTSLIIPYEVNRGCSHRCSFCNYYSRQPHVQFKAYERVLSELARLKDKYQSNQFFFFGSRINDSYEYLEKLCDLFIERDLKIFWMADVSVIGMDKHLLSKMHKAGCRIISWGIESTSERMLQKMNKGFTPPEAARLLQESHAVGIRNSVNFIIGFPTETIKDINQNIKFLRANRRWIGTVRVFQFMLSLKSPVYLQPEKFGIKNIRKYSDSKFYSPFFGFDEINGPNWPTRIKQQMKINRRFQDELLNLRLLYRPMFYKKGKWQRFLLRGRQFLFRLSHGKFKYLFHAGSHQRSREGLRRR